MATAAAPAQLRTAGSASWSSCVVVPESPRKLILAAAAPAEAAGSPLMAVGIAGVGAVEAGRSPPCATAAATVLIYLHDSVSELPVDFLLGVDRITSPDFHGCEPAELPPPVHNSAMSQTGSEEEVLNCGGACGEIHPHLVVEIRTGPVRDMFCVLTAAGCDEVWQWPDYYHVLPFSRFPQRATKLHDGKLVVLGCHHQFAVQVVAAIWGFSRGV